MAERARQTIADVRGPLGPAAQGRPDGGPAPDRHRRHGAAARPRPAAPRRGRSSRRRRSSSARTPRRATPSGRSASAAPLCRRARARPTSRPRGRAAARVRARRRLAGGGVTAACARESRPPSCASATARSASATCAPPRRPRSTASSSTPASGGWSSSCTAKRLPDGSLRMRSRSDRSGYLPAGDGRALAEGLGARQAAQRGGVHEPARAARARARQEGRRAGTGGVGRPRRRRADEPDWPAALRPSLVVSSGRGLHAYWRLDRELAAARSRVAQPPPRRPLRRRPRLHRPRADHAPAGQLQRQARGVVRIRRRRPHRRARSSSSASSRALPDPDPPRPPRRTAVRGDAATTTWRRSRRRATSRCSAGVEVPGVGRLRAAARSTRSGPRPATSGRTSGAGGASGARVAAGSTTSPRCSRAGRGGAR